MRIKSLDMSFRAYKYFFFIAMIFFVSCNDGTSSEIDDQKPTISVDYEEGFPKPCTELVRGETYTFKARATDNFALASYSLGIHHNFDHHTHDDQGALCELDPIKKADTPFLFMENYPIDNSLTTYEIKVQITVPNDVDPGDYHCSFSVTDQTGWQSRTSIDIKIIE